MRSAPTVAGLARNTCDCQIRHNTVEVLNAERDAAVLFATDGTRLRPEPEVGAAPAGEPAALEAAPRRTGRADRCPRLRAPDDISRFDAADATLALIALSAKMRIDQIEPLDSIESITDGASSRRNQLLVDLGSELNLGAIDGAAGRT